MAMKMAADIGTTHVGQSAVIENRAQNELEIHRATKQR